MTIKMKSFIIPIRNHEISERRGYKTHDIITLSDANPNLNLLLENFKKEHHHEDDEVRFIVSGKQFLLFKEMNKNGLMYD